ncbi:histidine kinase-, DNA gyrase B-, and HSP90-like ATPase family protein [Collimonas fungivorans]|jgi:chemotaxis protein histidine kinase CheA|uniref:Histidine kinase-, DNA gyrase B-, and HSP90-like ATPase family protein n=1 Tax=Collimonas fungivorans TaxID=158899 RepID=A0A127PFH3_9BURK|nr:histidine kinase [Collimonas fungivorans]AMO96384.1 histidine kinase-, DNA gyrase B-, and HSP90-like ATPase family protein [Collimonas fungivorans]
MNPDSYATLKKNASIASVYLSRGFDKIAGWVTQLSWWKFLLFAALVLAAAGILQETLFSSNELVIEKVSQHSSKPPKRNKGNTDIRIDDTGVHIKTGTYTYDGDGDSAMTSKSPAASVPASAAAAASPAADADDVPDEDSVPKTPPVPPAAPAAPAAPTPAAPNAASLSLSLPPEATADVNQAINDAVAAIHEAAAEKAEQQVARYQKKSSEWFVNFVLLLLIGLFGTKALMGGKKRAEARAKAANAAAEHANLQREVSEAKMQMIQAQVEPHFLFNTLASVDYLIETDPPRASAMQKRLIQYLRAVLPQMRETSTVTTLGREVDIVRAYLDLLKMRMEERLHIDLQVPEGLRSAAFPPMMLQSLVENAIKHGLERKADGGYLRIKAEVADNKLRVSVTDDGLGFGAFPSDGTGLGLQSIRERLKLLHGAAAQLEIAPNSPSGVCSTIEVPYQVVGSSKAKPQ